MVEPRADTELFDKDQSVIARHISNVFKEGELEKESNMQILHNTLSKYKPTQVYSLDVIISVGYRVKSKRGTQFRIWANKILKQYLLQGYAINERIAAQKYDELSQLIKVPLPHNPKSGKAYGGQPFIARCCCRLHIRPRHS